MLINIDCWVEAFAFFPPEFVSQSLLLLLLWKTEFQFSPWMEKLLGDISCWVCPRQNLAQHTQSTLPFSLGAPATPQDLVGSLPNWQRRALQWHLLSKNQYSEKLKSWDSERTFKTISSSSSSLTFYRSQISLKISSTFWLSVQKDMHVSQHVIFPIFSGALWIHHVTEFPGISGTAY